VYNTCKCKSSDASFDKRELHCLRLGGDSCTALRELFPLKRPYGAVWSARVKGGLNVDM
jgi:hypothetical protein